MVWPFKNKKKEIESRIREFERDAKVLESQRMLLEAATSTADAANVVTTQLRDRLSDSMRQLESTARILNDALIVCDAHGSIQAFNPAAERMFGLKADEVCRTFVGSLFFSEERPMFCGDDVWTLLREIDSAEARDDLMGVRKDGAHFAVDVNHTHLDRSDGQGVVLLILRDATAEKSYRSIFESSFDGILIVQNGTIVAANPALGRLFGYEIEALLGKPVEVLMSNGDGPAVTGFSETMDVAVEGVHYDGHAMNLLFTTTPILWGMRNASLVTVKDMSTFKPAEKPQSDMICCFDESFSITFVNSAFASFYGAKRADILGKDIRSIIPEREAGPFLLQISSLSRSEPTRRMQLRTTSPRGGCSVQEWTDHACYDGKVEYQRIGRLISEDSL